MSESTSFIRRDPLSATNRMLRCRDFCTFIFAVTSFYIYSLFNKIQPHPYIEEQYYVRQALDYCKGSYEPRDYNQTTLPGVHLFIVSLAKAVAYISRFDPCTIQSLRRTNVLTLFVNFIVIYGIYTIKYEPRASTNEIFNKILVSTFCVLLFPVSYFFSFLYYTDALSTTLVLVMYLLYLMDKHYCSAVIGLFAVLTKRTNIAWLIYVAAKLVIQDISNYSSKTQIKKKFRAQPFYKAIIATAKHVIVHGAFKSVIGYIVVGIVFVCIVAVNEGISLGDKFAPGQPVIHVMQVAYFGLFCLFFTLPYAARSVRTFHRSCRAFKNGVLIAVCIVVICCMVYVNTHFHPNLLPDNRHYMFYVWTLFFDMTAFRYVIIPVYVFAFHHVKKTSSFKSFPLYVLCVCITLVPEMSLDFRHFIPSYIMYRLHYDLNSMSLRKLIFELGIYCCINAITIFVFVEEGFYWRGCSEVQRMVW